MRTSIWYRTEEKNPDKSGHYLSYRGWGMGGKADGDHDHGYMYYDKKTDRWYEYRDLRDTAIVYYWTDATPDDWIEDDGPRSRLKFRNEHVSVQAAWQEVEEAIKRYEVVKRLAKV